MRQFGDWVNDHNVPVRILGTFAPGVAAPGVFGGSLQAQWTSAEDPCQLIGEATRVGIDVPIVGLSLDLLFGKGYWGWEFGPSFGAPIPNIHAYRETTSQVGVLR